MRGFKQIASIALVAVLGIGAARSEESGLAASHKMRKEGGRTCFADHFHTGNGAGATKEAAKAAAIKSWAEFVDFEYGNTWAHFGRASSVSVRYTKETKGWSADVDARPCR
jgi:hypothetical protein